MKTLADRKGHLRTALCFLTLTVNHGLRDFILLTVPKISYNEVSNTSEIAFACNETYSYNDQTEWDSGLIGGVGSITFWTWLITTILSPLPLSRFSSYTILGVSLFITGLTSTLTEVAYDSGPQSLMILRAFQGLFQGVCYASVYKALEGLFKIITPAHIFIVFMGSWIGSAAAAGLEQIKAFTTSYVFGSLALLMSPLLFLVPREDSVTALNQEVWKKVLTSKSVWVCVGVMFGQAWTLYVFIWGLSLSIPYIHNSPGKSWAVIIVVLTGGLFIHVTSLLNVSLAKDGPLSARIRRRIPTVVGVLFAGACLILSGTTGNDYLGVQITSCIIGAALGTSLSFTGVRLNFHDLGPQLPFPFLILGNVGSSLGAALSVLLFPLMCKIDENSESCITCIFGWMIPLPVLAVVTLLYLCLHSINPIPFDCTKGQVVQEASKKPVTSIIASNRASSLPNNVSRLSPDAKSFRSVRSAVTFKTAMSYGKNRTLSFQTIYDDIDGDMKSACDGKSEDCQSVKGSETSIKSAQSYATSFKSDALQEQGAIREKRFTTMLSVQDLDRTSAWISSHHPSPEGPGQPFSAEKDYKKNLFMMLQW